MNGKLPLTKYRTSNVKKHTTTEPLTPVKNPTIGTIIDVAEKNAAHDPSIKLILKKLAAFMRPVKSNESRKETERWSAFI